MANSPGQCAVLVPVANSIEPETEKCLQELSRRGYKVRCLRGCAQVDVARSILASEALRDGFAETLWIDSDVAFDPDDVDRLRAHDRPFTAGLYPKKNGKEFAAKFGAGVASATFGKGGGLLEMEYVGMGFVHVRADVYAKIASDLNLPVCAGVNPGGTLTTPYFMPMILPQGEGFWYLGEDYAFCHRARQVGFPVLADTTIRIGHVHRRVLTWDDLVPRQTHDSPQIEISMLR